MLVTPVNEWGLIIQSHTGRPATNFGATITPGINTYGSYASVLAGASVTYDVYGIGIAFNSNFVSTAARDTIVTIGLDPAGGSSFTDCISHLLASCAVPHAGSGDGVSYYFPLFIKAGSSIGAKASINNATVGTLRCWVTLYCQPSKPEAIKAGSFVTTFGANTAASRGTSVTPGTASEGAWTSLGALTQTHWYWQAGFGINSAAMATESLHMDLGIGDGSNNKIAISDQHIVTGATEYVSIMPPRGPCYVTGVSGDSVYGRLQNSGATTANMSMIAYGVGG
jgi:hypothetical protein